MVLKKMKLLQCIRLNNLCVEEEMNLLFDEDIKNKQYFDITLLINAVKESEFNSFIETISSSIKSF